MSKRTFWLSLALVVAIAAFFAATQLLPIDNHICPEGYRGSENYCPTYDQTLVTLWHLGKWANAYGIAISALATIAIAAFTYTLKRSTDRLWDAGEKQAKLVRKSLRLSRRLHAEEQRPWLALNVEGSPSLTWLGCFGTAVYDVQLRNVGKRPAFDAFHYHELLRNLPRHPVANFNLFVSECLKTHGMNPRDDPRSAVIFPGERPPNIGFQVPEGGRTGAPMDLFPDRLYLFLCACYRAEPDGPILHSAMAYIIALSQPAKRESEDGVTVISTADRSVPEITRFTAIGVSSAS